MYRTIRHHGNLQTRGGERSVIFNFRLSFRNNYCLTSINNCKGLSYKLFNLSQVCSPNICFLFRIYLFILHEYILNSHYDQLPVGLIAQLVEHCTGITGVMG